MVKSLPSSGSPNPASSFSASEASRDGADDAGHGLRTPAERLAVGVEIRIAAPPQVVEDADLPVEGPDRAVDPRPPTRRAGIVDQVARREVVAAVHHQVESRGQLPGIGCGQPLREALEARVRREGGEPFGGRLRLGTPHVLLGVERLPLEVALRNDVGIGQSDAAHPRARQARGGGRAQTAQPDDQHRGPGEPPLSFGPDLGEHRLACVACVVHGRQSKILSQSFHTTS